MDQSHSPPKTKRAQVTSHTHTHVHKSNCTCTGDPTTQTQRLPSANSRPISGYLCCTMAFQCKLNSLQQQPHPPPGQTSFPKMKFGPGANYGFPRNCGSSTPLFAPPPLHAACRQLRHNDQPQFVSTNPPCSQHRGGGRVSINKEPSQCPQYGFPDLLWLSSTN